MTLLSVKNLVVTRGEFPAIAEANLEIPRRSFTLVTGENGSGKTTLLKAISGISEVARGNIELDFAGDKKDAKNLRKHIAYVGHNALFIRHITVKEHLALTTSIDSKIAQSKTYGESDGTRYKLNIDEVTELFNLKEKLNVRVEDLSAGQQRRLHLASALVRSNPVLCIDEPHASLDEKSKKEFDEIIKNQFELGRDLIVATHDPDRLAAIATHQIEVVNGTCNFRSIK